MRRRSLHIGINYNKKTSELKGCVNDVLNVKKFLISKCGFNANDGSMRVMTELDADPSLKPTAANIISQIDWLVSGAQNGDLLVFNYSGHGGSIRDADGDEIDGRDETLCPLDYATAGQITDDLLRRVLIDTLPAGCTLFCLTDACHSGSMMDLRFNWVSHGRIAPAYRVAPAYVLQQSRARSTVANVFAISGCRDDQTSADAFEEGSAQGAMTYAFLKCAEPGVTPYLTLVENMNKLLMQRKYTQTPQLSCGRVASNATEHLFGASTPIARSTRSSKKRKL